MRTARSTHPPRTCVTLMEMYEGCGPSPKAAWKVHQRSVLGCCTSSKCGPRLLTKLTQSGITPHCHSAALWHESAQLLVGNWRENVCAAALH